MAKQGRIAHESGQSLMVLQMPPAYLFAKDDRMVVVILEFGKGSDARG
jgi:hypothetical protein